MQCDLMTWFEEQKFQEEPFEVRPCLTFNVFVDSERAWALHCRYLASGTYSFDIAMPKPLQLSQGPP